MILCQIGLQLNFRWGGSSGMYGRGGVGCGVYNFPDDRPCRIGYRTRTVLPDRSERRNSETPRAPGGRSDSEAPSPRSDRSLHPQLNFGTRKNLGKPRPRPPVRVSPSQYCQECGRKPLQLSSIVGVGEENLKTGTR
eukprot:716941-Hanusia_phi.AAC.1